MTAFLIVTIVLLLISAGMNLQGCIGGGSDWTDLFAIIFGLSLAGWAFYLLVTK